MHFQVKSLSGKSFTWSESMGPANLYSGLQKLPQSLWKPFLWLQKGLDHIEPLHRGAFCQFPFRWIYYYGSNESTRKETVKMHLCETVHSELEWIK